MNEVEKYFYTMDNVNTTPPKEKVSWKNFVFGTLAFALIASLLRISSFYLPFTTGIVKVEFSVPIVMLCLFLLGPWSALIVVIIKSVVHYFIGNPKPINVVFDMFVAIVIIMVCYVVVKFSKNTNLIKKTIFAGLLATVIVCISIFVFRYYIDYPVLNKHYNMTSENIVKQYQNHYSYIDSPIKCALLFDAPWHAAKALLGTIISAIGVKIKTTFE